jgi:DNA-binding NtrC family response regulator
MQVKLLRVLQEHQFEPLGAREAEKSDARIICATNRDLEKLVQQGKFRQDLYYRIHIIAMTIPPLRDRKEDIPLLADQFLYRFAVLNNKPIERFSPEVYARFYAYPWPGNIRELENAVERAVVLCPGPTITPQDLPVEIAKTPQDPADQGYLHEGSSSHTEKRTHVVDDAVAQTERELILRVLDRHAGNVTRAAQELGMHRATLYRKLKSLAISL